jgi:carbon monoxide dehydrogenase subunit G
MATIRKEFRIARPAAEVWEAFRDVGAVHTRLARGFVTDTKLEEGARLVTFANGFVARELLVTVDDAARRLAYAVTGSPNLTHHSASFQVFEDGGGSRVIWVADMLPDAAAATIGPMMDAGVEAMRTTLA